MAKGRGTEQHTEHLAKAATFVAVVRAGSLAAAAKQLAVGKSTLSEQLTALEDALGARLLERTSRGIALTQEGQVFFEGAFEEPGSLGGGVVPGGAAPRERGGDTAGRGACGF